jgi:hypothetical protein
MAAPFARDHQPLADDGHGDRSHHRHMAAAAVHPQDRVAVVVVLVNHGGNGSLQNFKFLAQNAFSPIQGGYHPIIVSYIISHSPANGKAFFPKKRKISILSVSLTQLPVFSKPSHPESPVSFHFLHTKARF